MYNVCARACPGYPFRRRRPALRRGRAVPLRPAILRPARSPRAHLRAPAPTGATSAKPRIRYRLNTRRTGATDSAPTSERGADRPWTDRRARARSALRVALRDTRVPTPAARARDDSSARSTLEVRRGTIGPHTNRSRRDRRGPNPARRNRNACLPKYTVAPCPERFRGVSERLPCALCGSYAGTPAGTVRGSFGSTAVPSPAATDPVL